MADRPDDLLSCNTNNGTERLNGDLKHDELVGYQNCSLSELLEIIIERFLPKLYRKYVSLNIRFTSGFKTYSEGIPIYLIDRPRQVVNVFLRKIGKVDNEMVASVIEENNIFKVTSDDSYLSSNVKENVQLITSSNLKKVYTVDFGSADNFPACECPDFRRSRLLCKHFFAVISSGKRTFHDLSSKFLNHPFVSLDSELFGEECNTDNNTPTLENNNGMQNSMLYFLKCIYILMLSG